MFKQIVWFLVKLLGKDYTNAEILQAPNWGNLDCGLIFSSFLLIYYG